METSSPCEKGYDGSRLKISMATLELFLNEPTCFNLIGSTVRLLNWQAELSIQFPSPQKPTFPNSNSIWNWQTLYHEPLARVIAQALPVFDIKFASFFRTVYFARKANGFLCATISPM